MSFTTNKPTLEGVAQNRGAHFARGGTPVAAFKPQVMRSVRMHPLLAAGVATAVFILLVGYALFQKQSYQAVSQVYEEPAAAKLLSDSSSGIFDPNKYETFLSEQIQLVQRLDVLTTAVKSLPQSTWADYGGTAQRAAETLQQQIKVVRVGSSYQISISLKGSDPQKTADLVNAVTTAYLTAVHKASTQDSDERAQLLTEERQRIETELSAARAEQAALGASIGVANPTGEGGNPYDAQLSGIRAQLTEARAAHDMAAAQLAALSGLSPARTSGLTAAADEVIAGDPGLGSLKATISTRKAQLNEQMSGMTPTNPVYKQDQDEIAELDKSLDAMTVDLRGKAARRLQDKLRSDLERTGDVEARLNGELTRQIATATGAAPKLQRASELGGDMQRLMLREAAVDDALRGLRLEANGPSQVRLSLAATAPESPEANRKKLLLLASLPLALLMGAFAAVFARRQDNKIYSGLDIDEVVGFPPLAVLPARGDVSERIFEEYVLRLAAGVESAYRTSGARTFLLTAVSLTTDIEPLATALVRKFGDIGVNAVVAAAADMLTPVGGLVTTDDGEPGFSLQLGSEGFVAANMARMKAEHGLVLIESQALANCAQTEYVARCADATILLIECGVTTREELLRAGELLERLNVKGIGTVLEELQLRFADRDFRDAIEALDKRQTGRSHAGQGRAMPRTVTRTPRVVEVPEAAVPAVETTQAAAMDHGEGASHAVIEVSEEAPVPVVAEAPVEVASEAPMETVAEEPSSLAEVVPMTPERVEEAVKEPLVEVAPMAAVRRAGVAAGPMLVVSEHIPVRAPEERFEEEPALALATGTLHEKMAPKMSSRRGGGPQDGDVRMARKTSWIHRLLGRDDEPVVSIVPEDDGSKAEPSVSESVREPETDHADRSSEEYDIPLANRLNQISRQRPVARLSIVPQERDAPLEEAVADPAGQAMVPEDASAAMDAAEDSQTQIAEVTGSDAEPISALVEQSSVAWPDGTRPDSEEKMDATEPLQQKAEPLPIRPKRPLSFPELAQIVQRTEQVSGSRHEAGVTAGPAAEEQHPAMEMADESYVVPVIESATEAEPFDDTSVRFVSQAAMEPGTKQSAVPESAAPAVVLPTEGTPLAVPVQLTEPTLVEEPSGIHAVVRQEQPEGTDVEPVIQEASRSLRTGRWDPIPPLRPGGESWRDRPSPVPPTKAAGYVERLRNAGGDEEAKTPNRWVPQAEPGKPEPQPETVLSRQWGLLSKFQQARISSSRPAVNDESDPERDVPGAGSAADNGKR